MGFLKDSIVKAADLEQTTLAFEVMLKSADQATEMIHQMRQYASVTAIQLERGNQLRTEPVGLRSGRGSA